MRMAKRNTSHELQHLLLCKKSNRKGSKPKAEALSWKKQQQLKGGGTIKWFTSARALAPEWAGFKSYFTNYEMSETVKSLYASEPLSALQSLWKDQKSYRAVKITDFEVRWVEDRTIFSSFG